MRGSTSQQAKSRSGQTAHESCRKELFYWCKNHSEKVLIISIKFLFKDSKCWRKGEVSASSIKRNQNIISSLIHRVYQRAIKSAMDFIKFQKQVPLFNGLKSREKKHPRQAVFNCKSKRIFQPMLHFWYKKGTSQLSKVSPKTALQGLSPDGLHGLCAAEAIFCCPTANSHHLKS